MAHNLKYTTLVGNRAVAKKRGGTKGGVLKQQYSEQISRLIITESTSLHSCLHHKFCSMVEWNAVLNGLGIAQ